MIYEIAVENNEGRMIRKVARFHEFNDALLFTLSSLYNSYDCGINGNKTELLLIDGNDHTSYLVEGCIGVSDMECVKKYMLPITTCYEEVCSTLFHAIDKKSLDNLEKYGLVLGLTEIYIDLNSYKKAEEKDEELEKFGEKYDDYEKDAMQNRILSEWAQDTDKVFQKEILDKMYKAAYDAATMYIPKDLVDHYFPLSFCAKPPKFLKDLADIGDENAKKMIDKFDSMVYAHATLQEYDKKNKNDRVYPNEDISIDVKEIEVPLNKYARWSNAYKEPSNDSDSNDKDDESYKEFLNNMKRFLQFIMDRIDYDLKD